ncbi:MAG: MarR family transcriptional regulator [Marinobacter sp.]|nr:MarR family transcriptional regulator [Marinobacter sp.]
MSALEQELAYLVRWLEAVQRRRRYKLERAHYLLLNLLVEDGSQSVGRIAARLRLDASTVTRQVAVMTKLGLVCKQPRPEDRRGGMVCATEGGRQQAQDVQREREQRVEELVEGWPEAKRRQLVDSLGGLNDSLCNIIDEEGA